MGLISLRFLPVLCSVKGFGEVYFFAETLWLYKGLCA